jgi:tetratricopeptide (TPR) repeat protein
LVGLLYLMGLRDLEAANAHYGIALSAARDAEDWDLASYALGSFAFLAESARRPADARSMGDAAWDLASRRATPRTRAWTSALNSELRARDGDETASRKFLEHAYDAIAEVRNAPAWKGVGWFDEARVAGYEGGNLALLGRHEAAEQALRNALGRLDPLRLKHLSTLSADLASVLIHRSEIERSCKYAIRALDLATSISHHESIDRVRGVHFRLLHWKTHSSVRQLTERLQAV